MSLPDKLSDINTRVGISYEEQPELLLKCRALSVAELLEMDIPTRENLLNPWLPIQGLGMVYARRGVGKTHVSIGIAAAVAAGGTFLNWSAPKPNGVLFIDGEMPLAVLQERVAHAVRAIGEPSASLIFITPDSQQQGMPDLSSAEGQKDIEEHINDEIGLIIIDNLSTLVRSGKENEGESWQPIQTWALKLRSMGKSILFIHHAGKGGQQRGSSRREDVLDTVISLKRPNNYTPDQGALFEVHFEKARGIHGDDTRPFEAALTTDQNGYQTWIQRTLEESIYEQVIKLHKDGLNQSEIAQEIDRHKSRVSRMITKAKNEGRI